MDASGEAFPLHHTPFPGTHTRARTSPPPPSPTHLARTSAGPPGPLLSNTTLLAPRSAPTRLCSKWKRTTPLPARPAPLAQVPPSPLPPWAGVVPL